MTLESQVVSLPLAKRMKELGVKQGTSLFHWLSRPWEKAPFLYKFDEPGDAEKDDKDCWSAFTVGELGEMLPTHHCMRQHEGNVTKGWVAWTNEHGAPISTMALEPTEADSRAKMLIYLIEQGLVKASPSEKP